MLLGSVKSKRRPDPMDAERIDSRATEVKRNRKRAPARIEKEHKGKQEVEWQSRHGRATSPEKSQNFTWGEE